MTDSFGVRAIKKEVLLFPSDDKSKEAVIKVEESTSEISIADHQTKRLKARFARLRKSIKKRGLGIL